jgi:hypothetical protein
MQTIHCGVWVYTDHLVWCVGLCRPSSVVYGSIQTIQLDVRSKMKACSRLMAGIASSNPAEVMDVLPCVVCHVGSGLCDGVIPSAEESYRKCSYLIVCDLETLTTKWPRPDLGCFADRKIKKCLGKIRIGPQRGIT